MKHFLSLFLIALLGQLSMAQDFGSMPKIDQQLLRQDLELLRQGLYQHHTGMFWYSSKDSVDKAFERAKEKIDHDMNGFEFFNLMAPLVGLSREDHTNISFSKEMGIFLRKEAKFLPLRLAFLDKRMYVTEAAEDIAPQLIGKEILSINGKHPEELVEILGKLFASDGFIKRVKYFDLSGFNFSKYHFIKYGQVSEYVLVVKSEDGSTEEIVVAAKGLAEIKEALNESKESKHKESLAFKILNDSMAYLGIHTFATDAYKENELHKNYEVFLENSFQKIEELNISSLIIDVSNNGGGNEGNENLLYSYVADNYQKYSSVCAKKQLSKLDNGIDPAIKLKTFKFHERLLGNKKMRDGSYCRKPNGRFGLMAYKKEPRFKFRNKLYIIIGPITYSGGSEFANMIRTQNRATFVGEETGGGYFGNTSGYSSELVLPHSGIAVDIPTLKFEMNVQGGTFGRGVIPDYEVIPTIQEYIQGHNSALQFILDGKAP